MQNQVPRHVHQERSRELAAVETELRDSYYRSLVGRRLRVLVETEERGTSGEERDAWTGTACRYATVEVDTSQAREGEFATVVAQEISGDRLRAGTPK